jgi:ribosomal peptide maturation radical SAM protein 1
MRMHENKKILLISMPFAESSIPSIQLALLEAYLKERNVNITTKNFYLNAAEIYGLNNYNFLINNPNDSYIAQLGFSKYLFPNHWANNIEKFHFFYENIISYDEKLKESFSFEKYLENTEKFYSYATHPSNWEKYDIIGFTLNYGQFLPSLALAKKIKEENPEKIIVFGGSTIINELGKKVLRTFDWIDFIISGEGEESLFLLVSGTEDYNSIPGLIYRKNKEIMWNKNNKYIDLNSLPYPDFQSYFQDLSIISDEVQQYHGLYGRLPIELSRGCWWNNCTFCNISAYNKKYREKTVERFVEELDFLSETYKILTFQVISNTLPQRDYKKLCEEIIYLDKDFNLFIETRAGRLKGDDYILLKKAGFLNIQTGIEAFSSNYLKKMNKGVKVIDNIAALKYCKENGILNHYNLIANYPNEEQIDFEETIQNIQFIKDYIDPPQISKFVVGFESPIYANPEKFNIEKLEYKIIDTIMYPPDVLENDFFFFNQFNRKKDIKENKWNQIVNDWKTGLEKREIEAVKRKTTIEKLIFYYIDGKSYIKIYDNRNHKNVMIYVLNHQEREILLSCENVISFNKLQEKLTNIPENDLRNILKIFEEAGILFRENDYYLSLPLNYSKIINNYNKEEPRGEFQKTISHFG